MIRLIACIFSVFFAHASFSATTSTLPEVNILAWWGLLTSPWVSEAVMEQCHVKIAYDEYYTNDDFMRRFHQYKEFYDIIIFPDMDYQALKNEIKNDFKSNLYKNARNYEPYIAKNYLKSKYTHNVAYFNISINGIVYNPNVVNLSKDDSIQEIFEKANSKTVILSEEPIYIFNLLNLDSSKTTANNLFSIFRPLTKNSKIVVTNQLSQAYSDSNFAFSYIWIGVGLYAIENQYKNYKFMIHPKFTIISADLLATLNNKKITQCVSSVFASKNFSSKMQNDSLYFSPYGDSDLITDSAFKKIHHEFFASLPSLKWIEGLERNKYNELYKKYREYLKEKSDDKSNQISENE